MKDELADLSAEQQLRVARCINRVPFHTLRSGGNDYPVGLESVHIERFMSGVLEFSIKYLRWDDAFSRHVLSGKVKAVYGERPWFLKATPAGIFPPYLVFAEVRSSKAIGQKIDDFSSLIVVWFMDELPGSLLAELTEQIQGIDWGKWAKDVPCD